MVAREKETRNEREKENMIKVGETETQKYTSEILAPRFFTTYFRQLSLRPWELERERKRKGSL